jgi:hypothetical protein
VGRGVNLRMNSVTRTTIKFQVRRTQLGHHGSWSLVRHGGRKCVDFGVGLLPIQARRAGSREGLGREKERASGRSAMASGAGDNDDVIIFSNYRACDQEIERMKQRTAVKISDGIGAAAGG